jgi:hypothetical protein
MPSASIGETQRTVLDERIEGSLDLAHNRSVLRVETRPRGSAIETLRGFDSRRRLQLGNESEEPRDIVLRQR